MKWARNLPLLASVMIGLALFSGQAVGAATVTAVLEPGRLTITDAPIALTYSSATTADRLRTLDATFGLGVTDASGRRAGWHIQAALGPLTRADGTPVPVRSSTVTEARVTALTGRTPISTLSYPRAFRTSGDTIFSAAAGSGVGKSALTFGAELVVPDTADDAPLTATLMVTIAAGP